MWKVATSDFIATKDHFKVVTAADGFEQLNGPKWGASYVGIEKSGGYLLFVTRPNGEMADNTAMTAFIASNQFELVDYSCLSFYFYNYGSSTGGVKVYALADNVDMVLLWSRLGSQEDSWLPVEINLASYGDILKENFSLIIEAERTSPFFFGSIAIDDLKLSDSCSEISNDQSEDFTCAYEGNDRTSCQPLSSNESFEVVQVSQLPSNLGLLNDASNGVPNGHVVLSGQLVDEPKTVSFQ